jgi:hypothetical protein
MGGIITIGSAPKKNAIATKNVLKVSIVIHAIITKRTIDEPSIENNCPPQKNKYWVNVCLVGVNSMKKLNY